MHSRARVVIGRLSSPKRTYGFISPEGDSDQDIYIAGRRINGAGHGDLVMARIVGSKDRAGKRPDSLEGEIIAVLERRPPFVAGVFRGDAHGGIVVPRDDRIASEIAIDNPPPEVSSTGHGTDGLVVWAEITSPEDRFRPAKGKIVSVLGKLDAPGVDETVIERTYQLPGEFPAEVTREASSFGSEVSRKDVSGREDFTGAIVVTVDPATARDHDDAVGLERVETPGGRVNRLSVHIADVSHYVREGGAIDLEALRRGTSVYFPGYAIRCCPNRSRRIFAACCLPRIDWRRVSSWTSTTREDGWPADSPTASYAARRA
jgi:ribonuclease R